MSPKRPLTVLVAATGMLLTACGSDGPSSSSAQSTPLPSGTSSSSSSPTSGIATQMRTVLSTLGLNIRDQDSPDGKVIGVLAQGAVVTVLAHSDKNGGWFRVQGQTVTGWMTDNPDLSSAHRFNVFHSDQRGFSALYRDNWTFAEQPTQVVFRPQSGPQSITLAIAASLDAFGQPGRQGYSVASADTILVYGVTGLLRLYDHTASAASPSPGDLPLLDHLAEYRATIDARRAIRIQFNYQSKEDLDVLRDFYNSVVFPAPGSGGTATPSPTH
jgi:hypothetical protein